jgi:hypothetical protein
MWQRHSATSLEVNSGSNGSPFLLVFGDAFHPEWEATVNGQPLPHVIVNGVSNGWIVPSLPQDSKIVLTFAAQRLYVVAGGISLISLILLVLLASKPELWTVRASQR